MKRRTYLTGFLLFSAQVFCQGIEVKSPRSVNVPIVAPVNAGAPNRHFDIVVVSGSSGGFGAALAAGRMGAKVALVEDTPVLGGMLSNGISNIDSFSMESLGGIFDEFRVHVKAYYAATDPNDPIFKEKVISSRHIDGRSQQSNLPAEGGRWEPHVADQILKKMMAAVPDVEVFYNETPSGVVMDGNRILGVTATNKTGGTDRFLGDVVIDATHEGDIAAWAGVPYSIGQEARSALEPHAGRIFFFDYTGEILPGSTGEQGPGLPSSGFRLTIRICKPGEAACRLLTSPPPGYKPEQYSAASFSVGSSMPHGKTEMNVNPIGSELPGANWTWPELLPSQRGHLIDLYRDHALGYLYYLQHQLGETNIGLAQDEYKDNGNVPYRMFVREGRRIHGEEVMTEADINPFILGRGLNVPFHADSIAVGHYAMDAKPIEAKTDQSTPDKGQGDFFLANVMQPFQIPFGAIVPQKIDNLLVPVALSATHVAFSAVRMDPTWMEIGQAAGVAAVVSLRTHVPVRQVKVAMLQDELLRQHCNLVFFWDVRTTDPYFRPIQWLSLQSEFQGGDVHRFFPDKALTRSDLASWVYKVERYTPSVSNVHFSDVPWSHPQFREIETLYDRGILVALGLEPLWKKYGTYDQAKFGGFTQASKFTAFLPDQPVTTAELVRVLRAIAKEPVSTDERVWLSQLFVCAGNEEKAPSLERTDQPITRADASVILVAFIKAQAAKRAIADSPITPGSEAGRPH